MRILVLDTSRDLFHQIESLFRTQIENNYLHFFFRDKIPSDYIQYNLIVADECFSGELAFIHSVPIVLIHTIFSSRDNDNKYFYVKKPASYEELSKIFNMINENKTMTEKLNNYFNEKPNEKIQEEKIQETKIINERKISPEVVLKESYSSKLWTKLKNNNNESERIGNILKDYGKTNGLEEKSIAQASIIIDEVLSNIVEKGIDGLKLTIGSNEDLFALEFQDNNGIIDIKEEERLTDLAGEYADTVFLAKSNYSNFIKMIWNKK